MIRATAWKTQPRGVTLLELTISLGVGLVVLGALFMLYMQTQRTSDRQLVHSQAVMEATLIADRLDRIFENSFDPQQFGAEWANAHPETFTANKVVLSSTFSLSLTPWAYYTIENETNDEGQPVSVGIRVQYQGKNAEPAEEMQTLESQRDRFQTRIEFSFANTINDELEAELQPSAAQRPAFIHYRVTIQDKAGKMAEPLNISSGVALK